MKKQYFALKASLPMLLFDSAPPLDSAEFLSRCEAFLPPERMAFLRNLRLDLRSVPEFESSFPAPLPGRRTAADSRAMAAYFRWEICLRNTLARLRSAKLGRDPESCTVKFAEYEPSAENAARNAFNQSDPLEKEKALDRARWEVLDGMEWNHVFNFEALCIYRCKLQILEKWAARGQGDPARNLEAAAERAEKQRKTE